MRRPELGDKCRRRETHVKDCKRHAAQSWETNVKDCRAEQSRVQSWEARVKDCKAEADTAAQTETKVNKSQGRQMNRNAAWPAEKGRHQQ